MAIPVYLFTGFLDSGKTTFLQETLEDPQFATEENTLVLLCESGEAELAPTRFADSHVTIASIGAEADITTAALEALAAAHQPQRILIEYNGMWLLPALYDAMPEEWELCQIVTLADSTIFPMYLNNLRQQTVDKLQDPEVVIFNRCTDATDKALLHRSVRMVNRGAAVLFERTDGSLDESPVADTLPFEKNAADITLADEDFGLWYLDAMEHPKDYVGKTLRFKAYVCHTPRAPKGCFIAGRFAMTCCAEDISYIGVICSAKNAAQYPHRSWVDIVAKISKKKHEIYEGDGPYLEAVSVIPSAPPKEELVYFLQ